MTNIQQNEARKLIEQNAFYADEIKKNNTRLEVLFGTPEVGNRRSVKKKKSGSISQIEIDMEKQIRKYIKPTNK
ncbi:hypothetical protein ATE49_12890 [Elizabethkingia miricola]|uniref:Uncharacterized protein n=1 Tax=Elizabethkingia miricola TaxID=172045 RepID=A0ABY3NCD2_ELIMR|nr:hypothetical protein [Elizabethkingia miricola]MCT4288681.1 hypothetical protein [Elizabethkingia anophelis]OBS13339.1 hypothetical protein ATE49_12890 [Elizabethkingia miricola]TYO84971.1 hypothetical protein LX74_03776 [Elizabethkingia miricola]